MTGSGMVVRAHLRRRLGAVLFLVLLIGLVGGMVMATVAGARRTETSVSRFNADYKSPYLQLVVPPPTTAQLAALRRAPNVVAVAGVNIYGVGFKDAASMAAAAPIDNVLGTEVGRARVVQGRLPTAPDEILLGESDAKQLHKRVGDTMDAVSYTPKQTGILGQGGPDAGPPAGPPLHFRVVGIVRRPLDLGSGGAGGALILSQAFNRAYAGKIGAFGFAALIRTRHDSADLQSVEASATKIFGKEIFGNSFDPAVTSLKAQNDGAQGAVSALAIALAIVAAATFVAGLVAIVIVLAREIGLQRVDQPVLDALGMTHGERFTALAAGGLIAGLLGTLLAVVVAVLASPLFPVGLARRAEPSLGVHADWLVLGVGALVLLAFVVVVVLALALRAAPVTDPAQDAKRGRIADLATQGSLPPTVTSGLRLALQRGVGQAPASLVPAVVGAVVGVVAVTAVLVFSANLDHLERTPRLYGWTWDVKANDQVSNETSCSKQDFGVLRQPGIGDAAAICYGTANITVDGRSTNGWAYVPLRGNIGPEIIAGRAPASASEVALGATTMHVLRKHIGDHVTAVGPKGPRNYFITGETVFPSLGEPQPLADGAAFTDAGFAPLFDQNNFFRYIVARFTPGADRAAVERQLGTLPGLANVTAATQPPDIVRLRQIDWAPPSIAILLGLLALTAVGYAIVSAVRRRRRDLAVLKTLGFDRGQVRATVAWQATTLAAIGLLVGVPVGIVLGRLVWRLVADRLGVLATSNLPLFALVLVVPAVVILANAVAFLPARAAARVRPATVLRSQ